MPRRTSLGRRCYNPFSKENHKRDPCSLRTISATLQKMYASIPIDAKLCVNCRKEIPQLALRSKIENLYKKCYLDDENSRMMPGMKDFVSVKKDDGSRKHDKKKLILCNLSELHPNFKAQHPTVKICLPKFSQLRPRNCIHSKKKNFLSFVISLETIPL